VIKQFSAQAIEQILAQAEGLTEVQLKGLLERLESQKILLPYDDHPIIDWGISTLKIRLKERREVMDVVQKKLEAVVKKCVDELDKSKNLDDFFSAIVECIEEVLRYNNFAYKEDHRTRVMNVIDERLFDKHKKCFIGKQKFKESLETLIKWLDTFTAEYIIEYQRKTGHGPDTSLHDYYKSELRKCHTRLFPKAPPIP
jgi:hypothetical protein